MSSFILTDLTWTFIYLCDSKNEQLTIYLTVTFPITKFGDYSLQHQNMNIFLFDGEFWRRFQRIMPDIGMTTQLFRFWPKFYRYFFFFFFFKKFFYFYRVKLKYLKKYTLKECEEWKFSLNFWIEITVKEKNQRKKNLYRIIIVNVI